VSGGWVAGSVRARLLVAERTLGAEGTRRFAASATLRDALVELGRTPYRRDVTLRLGLAEAQRAVAAKTLLDLRLLAGWLPGDALGVLRDLAAWYELANIEDRLGYLGGGVLREPFELGSLAVAWPRASAVLTLDELRRVLAASDCGSRGRDASRPPRRRRTRGPRRRRRSCSPASCSWSARRSRRCPLRYRRSSVPPGRRPRRSPASPRTCRVTPPGRSPAAVHPMRCGRRRRGGGCAWRTTPAA
jgi:hypothetical protein